MWKESVDIIFFWSLIEELGSCSAGKMADDSHTVLVMAGAHARVHTPLGMLGHILVVLTHSRGHTLGMVLTHLLSQAACYGGRDFISQNSRDHAWHVGSTMDHTLSLTLLAKQMLFTSEQSLIIISLPFPIY